MKLTFLQRHTPWWLLQFLNRHTHSCWAEIAMWKMGYNDTFQWRVRASCWGEPSSGYDYCGRWQTREEMKLT